MRVFLFNMYMSIRKTFETKYGLNEIIFIETPDKETVVGEFMDSGGQRYQVTINSILEVEDEEESA